MSVIRETRRVCDICKGTDDVQVVQIRIVGANSRKWDACAEHRKGVEAIMHEVDQARPKGGFVGTAPIQPLPVVKTPPTKPVKGPRSARKPKIVGEVV